MFEIFRQWGTILCSFTLANSAIIIVTSKRENRKKYRLIKLHVISAGNEICMLINQQNIDLLTVKKFRKKVFFWYMGISMKLVYKHQQCSSIQCCTPTSHSTDILFEVYDNEWMNEWLKLNTWQYFTKEIADWR